MSHSAWLNRAVSVTAEGFPCELRGAWELLSAGVVSDVVTIGLVAAESGIRGNCHQGSCVLLAFGWARADH